ncbi:MAG: hypothetical protein ABH824_05715 [Nanoarchaeota archaeon]
MTRKIIIIIIGLVLAIVMISGCIQEKTNRGGGILPTYCSSFTLSIDNIEEGKVIDAGKNLPIEWSVSRLDNTFKFNINIVSVGEPNNRYSLKELTLTNPTITNYVDEVLVPDTVLSGQYYLEIIGRGVECPFTSYPNVLVEISSKTANEPIKNNIIKPEAFEKVKQSEDYKVVFKIDKDDKVDYDFFMYEVKLYDNYDKEHYKWGSLKLLSLGEDKEINNYSLCQILEETNDTIKEIMKLNEQETSKKILTSSNQSKIIETTSETINLSNIRPKKTVQYLCYSFELPLSQAPNLPKGFYRLSINGELRKSSDDRIDSIGHPVVSDYFELNNQ